PNLLVAVGMPRLGALKVMFVLYAALGLLGGVFYAQIPRRALCAALGGTLAQSAGQPQGPRHGGSSGQCCCQSPRQALGPDPGQAWGGLWGQFWGQPSGKALGQSLSRPPHASTPIARRARPRGRGAEPRVGPRAALGAR